MLLIDGEPIFRCPVTMVTPETALLCKLYPHYTRGVLPVTGGLLEQSATFLAAMEILSAEVAALHTEK